MMCDDGGFCYVRWSFFGVLAVAVQKDTPGIEVYIDFDLVSVWGNLCVRIFLCAFR